MATLEELQAQITALQAAVDGMTAPPTDYYTLLKSGEEVDAILSRAEESGALDESIAKVQQSVFDHMVGINLLDNWYFVNPVNQRGQTSYAGAGYTIDRWKKDAGDVVTLGGDGVTYDVTGSRGFYQPIENPELYSGKVMTLSLLARSDNGGAFAVGIGGGGGYSPTVPASGSGTLQTFQFKGAPLSFVCRAVSGKVAFIAAKLELGDQQTLAHQDESGNWVINEIPDYGTELAKCQRYQFINTVGQSEFIRADHLTANAIYFHLPTPVTMRTTPVLESSAALGLSTMSNAAQSGFQFAYVLLNNGIRIAATKTNHGLTDARLDIAKALFTCNL